MKIPNSSLVLLEMFPVGSVWLNLEEDIEYELTLVRQNILINYYKMESATFINLSNYDIGHEHVILAEDLKEPQWKKIK